MAADVYRLARDAEDLLIELDDVLPKRSGKKKNAKIVACWSSIESLRDLLEEVSKLVGDEQLPTIAKHPCDVGTVAVEYDFRRRNDG